MADYSRLTLKKLFGLSMNVCAFPTCEESLIDPEWLSVLGQICHICARSPRGPRYDKNMTDKERYDFDNLILLCPTHHTLIDQLEPNKYTKEVLWEMKAKMNERGMQGEKRMLEQLGDDFVNRAIVEIINVSERYYSLPPLPPMAAPVHLVGRAQGVSTVTGVVTVPLGDVSVAEEGSIESHSTAANNLQVNFTASMTGADDESRSDDVVTTGGPSASFEHEVVRAVDDEIFNEDASSH
jgi:hypothetical protein